MGIQISQNEQNHEEANYDHLEEAKEEPDNMYSLIQETIYYNTSDSIYEKSFIPSISYNDSLSIKSDRFQETCPMCYENLEYNQKVSLPCHSSFCISCIKSYLENKITSLEVLKISCPMPECPYEFTKDNIRPFISQELLEKYSILLRNEELTKNPYFKWCPTPDCNGYDFAASDKTELICNICCMHYCYNCANEWVNHHKCKVSEKSIEYWFKKGVRYCPNCKRKVEKSSGCDHMTCTKCKYEWCWLCGEKYDYGHFTVCEIIRLRKLDPAWGLVFLLIFVPLICLVSGIIAGFYLFNKINSRNAYTRHIACKIICYIMTLILSLLVTPIILVTMPLVIGVISIRELFSHLFYTTCYIFITLIFAIILYPLVFISGVMGLLGLHVAGWLLLIRKIKISLRRCFDPHYLIPKSLYAKKTIL
jgi:IBR domain, a half RING-finger domain